MKNIKRILALVLGLCLLLSLAPAMAASNFENDVPRDSKGNRQDIVIKRNGSAVCLVTTIKSTTSGVIELTVLNYTKDKAVVKTESRNVSAGDKVEWKLDFDEELPNAKSSTEQYVMRVSMDGKKEDYSLFLTYHKKDDTITVEKGEWYSNNTACVAGLPLRDMNNPITTKWYHVLPIDLSIQGDQEFDYVAGNMYIIGKITVTVSGDYVFVNFKNYYEAAGGNTETLSEYMTFFHDMSEVTQYAVENNAAPRNFAFGQAISIRYDLEGDTNVLLFVCNHVTYRDYVTGTHKLSRYWTNSSEYTAYRTALTELMNRPDPEPVYPEYDGAAVEDDGVNYVEITPAPQYDDDAC
ncbi:MAG: hypothetical protein CW338_02385 [Clostridiales bacterium]|nr:hypothetical protein [Clostridiales bacterium]